MNYYDNKKIMLKNECASLQNSEELMDENDVSKENIHELKCQALQQSTTLLALICEVERLTTNG